MDRYDKRILCTVLKIDKVFKKDFIPGGKKPENRKKTISVEKDNMATFSQPGLHFSINRLIWSIVT